ncbi:unnamed protein product, partial [Mesorhabditis belari]|uniref:Protein kinase domain-containing protein n=1 Tax=Mesorhabditis belari TaxID=2138241 RepID=A0AAF3EEC2_9BILA
MEYCERNSLRKVLPDPKILYNTKTVYVWTEQLFSVLKCLDEHQVVHRDLKPENVMATYNFILKVGDFGLATSLSDLYAVGLIIWEIIERTRVYPQFAASPSGIGAFLLNMEKGEIRVPVPDCDEKLKGMVRSCTEINPTERIPIQEVYPKVVAANKTITKYDFTPMAKENQTILMKPKDVDELLDKEFLVKMSSKLETEISFQENSVEVLTSNSSNSLPSDPNPLSKGQSWVRYPAKGVDPVKKTNIIHQQLVKEQLKAKEDDVVEVGEEMVSKTGTSSSDVDNVEDGN